MQSRASEAARLWPDGGGLTGRLLRDKDWRSTPLGAIETWPVSLRTAVEIVLNSPVPIVMLWGADGVMIYNDGYSEFAGARHPALFGSKVLEGWPEVADFNRGVMAATFRGETLSFRDRQLVLHRNGRPEDVWLNLDYSPIFDAGRPAGVFAVVLETTQRVLAERQTADLLAQARSTAATLQQWFEQAPGFVILLRGENLVIEMVNDAYYQLVGPRKLVGLPLFEALPEVRNQGFEKLLADVRVTGAPFVGRAMPLQVRREHGGPLVEAFIDFVYQPVFGAGGRVDGIFAQGHEVTEQVRAADELREADRRKDAFLATLAHELRNPLAPIRTAAHLLQRPSLPPERLAECSALIARQSRTMALLLDDLLDVARITSGKIELHKTRVELGSIVDAAMETAGPLIEAKGHELTLAVPPGPVMLEVDPLRIAQALTNLLANAAKYTDPGGRIRLDVALKGDAVRFEVIDNGAGIAADVLPSLFEMFHQAEPTLSRSEGGLGIGLALSKGLVELHGGTVEAISAGLGRGATFRLIVPSGVPRGERQDRRDEQASEPPLATAVHGHTILVADDNIDAASSLAMLLELDAYSVHVAHDGASAFELAARLRPDVAFLDIGMPKLDGYALASKLRAEPWGREMLLIATTGWGHEDDKQRALAAGFDLHLTKPIDPEMPGRLLREHCPARPG